MKNKILILFVLSFFYSIIGLSQVVTDGLVAYYPFNGNILDESGNANDGQNMVGAILSEDRFNQPNSAYDFTTSDAYVDLGNIFNNVFAGAGKKFSISLWIKPHIAIVNGNIVAKISDFGCGGDERMIFLKIFGPDSKMTFTYNSTTTGGNARRVVGSTSFTNFDKWYHVVVTYDGSINTNGGKDRVKLFVDCKEEETILETSSGFLGDIQESQAHLGIGSYLDNNGNSCFGPHNFKGLIDDLYIFDRLLTEEEIKILGRDIEAIDLGADTTLCQGEQLTLIPTLTNSIEDIPLTWHDGSDVSEYTITAPGTYWVRAGLDGTCSVTDSINVSFEICTGTTDIDEVCHFNIPSLISRRGIQFNVKSDCTFKDYQLNIYSNTGRSVYQTTDQQASWPDASFYANGMYYYTIAYQPNNHPKNSLYVKTGKLVLMEYQP